MVGWSTRGPPASRCSSRRSPAAITSTPSCSTAPRVSRAPGRRRTGRPRLAARPRGRRAVPAAAAGCAAGPRDLTAAYVKEREQFGRSLAEFQAVAHADRRRLHRLAHPRPRRRERRLAGRRRASTPTDDLAVAAYWTCTEAPGRAAHLPPPARRHGRRRDLPAAPLLLLGHRPRPRLAGRRAPRPSAVEDPTAKNLELTAAQRALQGRAARLLRRPRGRRGPSARWRRDRHGETYQRIVRQMGERRLDGRRLAEGVRRPRARRDRAARSSPTRRSAPTCTCPR